MNHQPLNSGLLSLRACECLRRHLRGLNQVPQLRKSARACLRALCMKHANSISEEVWWRCWSLHFSKPLWLPVVLTMWAFLPFFRDSFPESIHEGWGLRESGACFLVTFLLFACQWHLQWKTCWGSTWLRSDVCSVPLTHWLLNYLLSCLHCAATTGRQGRSLQYGWHVPCFPTACHM